MPPTEKTHTAEASERTKLQESLMPVITPFENAAFDCGLAKGCTEWDASFAALAEARNKHLDYIAALLARNEEMREALTELLFAFENADETGYVTDVGFIKDFDKLNDKCRSALTRAASVEVGK